MLDFLESMEAAAEARHDKMAVDADHYRCGCGKVTPNSEMNFLSPSPYSEPSCGACFDEYVGSLEKQTE